MDTYESVTLRVHEWNQMDLMGPFGSICTRLRVKLMLILHYKLGSQKLKGGP